eukprot:2837466-Karenia_brevis.AAC.1
MRAGDHGRRGEERMPKNNGEQEKQWLHLQNLGPLAQQNSSAAMCIHRSRRLHSQKHPPSSPSPLFLLLLPLLWQRWQQSSLAMECCDLVTK